MSLYEFIGTAFLWGAGIASVCFLGSVIFERLVQSAMDLKIKKLLGILAETARLLKVVSSRSTENYNELKERIESLEKLKKK